MSANFHARCAMHGLTCCVDCGVSGAPFLLPAPAPRAEDDLCEECGADISTGYSWEGFCVVCAERYHNIEHPEHTS